MQPLFAFFGFWGTTLLAAAGAASIPIIVHLLNRQRYRVTTWAAMRFLLNAQKQNTRRMRLEQWILLAVRTLLILLIVGAMASVMPWAENVWAKFFPEGAGFITQRVGRTHKVIVLDASLSMNLDDQSGRTVFDRARAKAIQIVKDAQSGDGFSVLLLKEVPVWVVPGPSVDSSRVVKVLRDKKLVYATHGNAGVGDALSKITGKLTESRDQFTSHEVYYVTDLQKATWGVGSLAGTDQPAAADKAKNEIIRREDQTVLQRLNKLAATVFVDVGRNDVSNLAVTDLTLDASLVTTGKLVPVSATVQNYGAKPVTNVQAELVYGKMRQNRLLELKPGERQRINFGVRFKEAGVFAVQLRLSNDRLKYDNVRSVIVKVKKRIPVMLVNGKPAVEPVDRATEYLRRALDPPTPPGQPRASTIRPKTVSVSQFADASDGELADYDCIFLCDVKQFTSRDLRRLRAHLRRGGGLVFSVGDNASEDVASYNDLLFGKGRGILPVKLVEKVRAPEDAFYRLTDGNFREPPLEAFANALFKSSLRSARFRQYMRVSPSGVLLPEKILSFSLDDRHAKVDERTSKDAAIVAWKPPLPSEEEEQPSNQRLRFYRGRVIFIATTLNMDWNSWAGSPSYLPMMQELLRYAVAGKLAQSSYVVSDVLEAFLPSAGSELRVKLQFPPGSPTTSTQLKTELEDDVNVFRYSDTDISGIYRLTTAAEERLFAVNVPTSTADKRGSESDLTRVEETELRSVLPKWKLQVVNDPADARIEHPNNPERKIRSLVGPVAGRYMLLGALILLFAEIILAWQFGHYSAAAGSVEGSTQRARWPLVLAGSAAVLFLAGAAVLVHAAYTGDFLGFLPDSFRRWIEVGMDVPPPSPGEGTRWRLDTHAFLVDRSSDVWLSVGIAALAVVMIVLIYQAEGPTVGVGYKIALGALRLFLILMMLAVLLPQLELRFDRQAWPNVVLIIDDSLSMGESDHYRNPKIRDYVAVHKGQIREHLRKTLEDQIDEVEGEIDKARDDKRPPAEIRFLVDRRDKLRARLEKVDSEKWKPSRLQLAKSLIHENNWLKTLLAKRRVKIHIYHLDAEGKAIPLTDAQGRAGDIEHDREPQAVKRARTAVARLTPQGEDSKLGSAARVALQSYQGAPVSAVIMLTDGVTTRGTSLSQVGKEAAKRGVPLFFVGIGDDQKLRDLKLHDLQVADTVYVNDRVIFQAKLTGQGFKDPVKVLLKVRDKDGEEKILDEEVVQVDPEGNPVRVVMHHRPEEVGRKLFIMEVKDPEADAEEKRSSSTRLERFVDVIKTTPIKVLYVEQEPRYEFRFIKFLLERERSDDKKRTIQLKVVLLDADPRFSEVDQTALADFPATRKELDKYDVVILGDVDPRSPKLGPKRLQMLADFVQEREQAGRKIRGGGLLLIAGPNHNPHSFRDTPLADVMPIEPEAERPIEQAILDDQDAFRLQLTPVGREHPIFRFKPDDTENSAIWKRLKPMFWSARGYRIKPLADVLAVHPVEQAIKRRRNQDRGHPLVVQQFVGSGRTMFFGFEETWRWRFREDEVYFNKFWIQTMRYLSPGRQTRTVLRLDRQTPYRPGEPIKVTVRFPDNEPLPGEDKRKVDADVRVMVKYRPHDNEEYETLPPVKLSKIEGSWATFEALQTQTPEGRYRFRLVSPDVRQRDSNGKPIEEKPTAEARVERPPGELDRLRMDEKEMQTASGLTHGGFYTLLNANDLLDDLPAGRRVALATPRPPWLLWNHWLCFVLVVMLLTAEWFLRKRKHLL